MDRLITKEKVFVQTNQLAEILINSNGYEDFHNNIVKNNIVCEESKNYEIAGAGFIWRYKPYELDKWWIIFRYDFSHV